MPTKFVVEVGEDIIRDVREYAKAQGVQPYEWISQIVRISCGKDTGAGEKSINVCGACKDKAYSWASKSQQVP